MRIVHLGDCRDVLASIADSSIDSIVTDPPYELGFMGKAWDASGIAYDMTVWRHCLRVLKPGGHLIAFGGSRTYHRMAVAIEDAGFEIRDQIQWVYGSGFPKSLDVSMAMDKQAGAERTVVTEKREDMFGEYEVEHTKIGTRGADGTGHENAMPGKAIGVKQVKKILTITAPATDLAKQWQGWGTALKPAHEPAVLARKPLCGTVADNITAWGVGAINVDECRIDANGETYQRTGLVPRLRGYHGIESDDKIFSNPQSPLGRWPANVIFDDEAAAVLGEPSRFFYVAKVSASERQSAFYNADGTRANHHPTVKPLALMRYLVRMVTPKGGIVLDPFTGSGSTGCAAVLEGCDFVGMDITPEYVEIAQKRIAYYAVESPLLL